MSGNNGVKMVDNPDLSDAQGRRDYWLNRGYAAPINVGDFMAQDYRVEFLVDRCLAKNSPCVIAGASKSLKTTISLHLALSLASGQDFLGAFSVTQTPVMFASAESGQGTLQRNLAGMAALMDVDLEKLNDDDALSIQFWVPRISDSDMLAYFGDCIDQTGAQAVVVDPLYLAMDGDTQGSLGLNGDQIQKLVKVIIDKGATPIIDDHVKRSSANAKEFQPIQLDDISGAGKAEYFRQWMLLGRRSKYEDDDSDEKSHELWLTAGGSAGHSATWGLDVTETFTKDFREVEYSMSLTRGSEARDNAKAAQVDKQAERKTRQEVAAQKSLEAKCLKVAAEMTRKPDQLFILSDIRAMVKVSADKAREIVYELEATSRIVKHPAGVKRGPNNCEAWQAPGTALLDLPDGGKNAGQPWKP